MAPLRIKTFCTISMQGQGKFGMVGLGGAGGIMLMSGLGVGYQLGLVEVVGG